MKKILENWRNFMNSKMILEGLPNEFGIEDNKSQEEKYAQIYTYKDFEYKVPKQAEGNKESFTVEKIPSRIGISLIRDYHYAVGCHNGPMTFGLLDANRDLIGVCAFNTPCSEAVRSSVFGAPYRDHVTELGRLAIIPSAPHLSATWFVSRCLKMLNEYRKEKGKSEIWAVLSFADSTEGHHGGIYQGTNWWYANSTSKCKFYRDPKTGRLHHPRQTGVNITTQMAHERGWCPEMRDSKYRYVFFMGSARQKVKYLSMTTPQFKRLLFVGVEEFTDEELQNSWRELLRNQQIFKRDYPK